MKRADVAILDVQRHVLGHQLSSTEGFLSIIITHCGRKPVSLVLVLAPIILMRTQDPLGIILSLFWVSDFSNLRTLD